MSGVGDNFQLKIKHNHRTRFSTTIITDAMAVELIIPNSMKSRNWGISWDFISFGADWGGWWSSIVADLLDMIEYQHTYKNIGRRPWLCPLLGLYRKDAYAKTRFRGRVRFIKIRRVVGMVMAYPCKIEATIWCTRTYLKSAGPAYLGSVSGAHSQRKQIRTFYGSREIFYL